MSRSTVLSIIYFSLTLLSVESVFALGIIYPGTNYCGPGQRRGFSAPALNAVDEACRIHDLCVIAPRQMKRESRFKFGPGRGELKHQSNVDRCVCDQTFFNSINGILADSRHDARTLSIARNVRGLALRFFSSCRKAGQ